MGRSARGSCASFIVHCIIVFCAAPAWAAGEPRRVGLVWSSLPQSELENGASRHPGPALIAQRLRELGWTPGKNLELVSRTADSRYERFPAIVDEMVARRVDVLVVFGPEAARVAKARAPRIPTVWSLAYNRHGGRGPENMTGMAAPNPLSKRLEFLKSLAPRIDRVAMVARVAPNEKPPTLSDSAMESVRRLGLDAFALYFAEPVELDGVFAEAVRRGANAMYMSVFPRLTWDEEVQRKVAGLASLHRLPTVYEMAGMASAGGLLAFGIDERETHRRTADYVDRILRGARPSDLPMEEPLRYLLGVNARTARELGLSIPDSLRLQADQVFD